MDFITQWIETLPWYAKWLVVTFCLTFSLVLVRRFATVLAEMVVAFLQWLLMLPVQGARALLRKRGNNAKPMKETKEAELKKAE